MSETPWRDPADPGNDFKYHTGKSCLLCLGPAGTEWSPFFCQKHNAERIDLIDSQFTIIERSMTKKDAGWNVEIFKKKGK